MVVLERYPHMRGVMENIAKQRLDDCSGNVAVEAVFGKSGNDRTKKREARKAQKAAKERRRRKHESRNGVKRSEREKEKQRDRERDKEKDKERDEERAGERDKEQDERNKRRARPLRRVSNSHRNLHLLCTEAPLDRRKNNSFSGLGIVALKSVGGKLDALTLEALSGLPLDPSGVKVRKKRSPRKSDTLQYLSFNETTSKDEEEKKEEDEYDDGGIYFNVASETVITTLDVQET